MGIRGLMTYINRNPKFLEPYQLHGGYLVIDGLALAGHLFFLSECNTSMGSDHDIFSNMIARFFEDLARCEVIPLVILDGGAEDKKRKTLSDRMESALEIYYNYTPASQSEVSMASQGFELVFLSKLKQLRVRTVRCPFEADSSIAGVAKILDCPVLSRDSDFYVFGVNYISTDDLAPFSVKGSWGRGRVIPCKIFRPHHFLRVFSGLDLSALPLAAVLLGNDYVKRETFEKFFANFQFSEISMRIRNLEQRRIDGTFRWLRNYNLNDALAIVLAELPRKRRREVLPTIENVLEGYLNLPIDMLLPLGFAKKHEAIIRDRGTRKSFKFEGDIDALQSKLRETSSSRENIAGNENSSEEDEAEAEEETREEKSILVSSFQDDRSIRCSDDDFVASWPGWFARRFKNAELPSSFIAMMRHRTFVVPVNVEDFNYPSMRAISLKLFRVMDGLLVSGRENSAADFLCIMREGKEFVEHRMDTIRCSSSTVFPPLSDLHDSPLSTKRQIFYDALEIEAEVEKKLVDEIPSHWRLYLVSALYWMRQTVEPSRNSLHLRALLLTMLLGVIDRKIEHCRSLYFFEKRYGEILAKIEEKLRSDEEKGVKKKEKRSESLMEALKNVTMTDCLLAARFFMSSCKLNPKLIDCPERYNVTIVHAFAQFQSCLISTIHLNSLLGFVLEPPIIGEFYNGTMLYNVYTSFEGCEDVDGYIGKVLEKSPGLLLLLNLLTEKVNEMLGAATVDARGNDREASNA